MTVTSLCAHGAGLAFLGSTPRRGCLGVDVGAGFGRTGSPGGSCRPVEPADVSRGEPLVVTGRSGRPVHGTLYPPALRAASGPPGAPPPLVVWSHGGPTASSPVGLDLTVQFFTTRGFALACVDYAGSSGYGRAYRDALAAGGASPMPRTASTWPGTLPPEGRSMARRWPSAAAAPVG